MRHLFVVDSLDKHIQNEKELIRPRRLLPAARATRARSAQFYVVLIRHDSTGVGGLFCICVESINLNLNFPSSHKNLRGYYGGVYWMLFPPRCISFARQAGSEIFASFPCLLTSSLLACSARPRASRGFLCRRGGNLLLLIIA